MNDDGITVRWRGWVNLVTEAPAVGIDMSPVVAELVAGGMTEAEAIAEITRRCEEES